MKVVLLLAGWLVGRGSVVRAWRRMRDVRPAQACSTHFDVAGGGGASSEELKTVGNGEGKERVHAILSSVS